MCLFLSFRLIATYLISNHVKKDIMLQSDSLSENKPQRMIRKILEPYFSGTETWRNTTKQELHVIDDKNHMNKTQDCKQMWYKNWSQQESRLKASVKKLTLS